MRMIHLPETNRRFCNAFVRGGLTVAVALCLAWGGSRAYGQAAAGDGPELPAAEDIALTTADGLTLAATYYPGTEGRDTVPVILLHGLKGSRNDFATLAPYLQELGHAVLVPDLRGHGDSTQKRGAAVPLSANSLSRLDYGNMVTIDMPTLKAYLVAKNNAGELNIEKLCLVGAELGASVALNYTYYDWTRPTVGNKKQGQDVKGVVLLSPEWSSPGLTLSMAMRGRPIAIMAFDPQLQKVFKEPDTKNFQMPTEFDFRKEVSFLIVVGKGKSKAVADAERLQKMLKPYHPDPEKDQRSKRDLFYGELDTSLQGTKMLGVRGVNVNGFVGTFINMRLVEREFPWAERVNPYAR